MTFKGHFGDLLTVVTLCARLTRDLLAIAKFLVVTSVIRPNICIVQTVERYILEKFNVSCHESHVAWGGLSCSVCNTITSHFHSRLSLNESHDYRQ